MRRAFTLIELLVVIAVIGLLMALFLPSLAGARRTAKATMGFGNLRSLSQIMAAYAGEHREAFLNPFRPVWPANSGMTWSMVQSQSDATRHWDFLNPICPQTSTEGFAGLWYSYLAEYRGGRRNDPEQISPADPELTTQYRNSETDQAVREGEVLMPTSFLYPPVFWSKPSRFMAHCRDQMGPQYIETAYLGSVTYPSAKVLLFERADFGSGRTPLAWSARSAKTHVALVDGSCDTIDMSRLYAAMEQSNNADLIATITCCFPNETPVPFLTTFRGIQGRDLPR